ncbi:MAG: septation protein A [Comamonadaceae bacterium]|mgnify:FL=1|jgi:intracellular septation protein
MRLLIDFFPIAFFVIAYRMADIYTATGVLMASTVLQTAVLYAMEKKVATVQKATLALILIFGGLTLSLHDERFIQWKPTVLYSALALVLLVALTLFKRNLLRMMLGAQLKLPAGVWDRLCLVWAVYFLAMGALNAFVATYYTLDQWVDFKIWGYAFPVVFIIGQGLYVAKYLKESDKDNDKDGDNKQNSGETP